MPLKKIILSTLMGYQNDWFMVFNVTFKNILVGGQFYWWRKPKYLEKNTDLSQVTDKLLSHNVVSSAPRLSGIQTHNVSGNRH